MIRAFIGSLLARRPLLVLALVLVLCVILSLLWEPLIGAEYPVGGWLHIGLMATIVVTWLAVEAGLFAHRRHRNARVLENLLREGVTLRDAPTDTDVSEVARGLHDAVDFLRREMVGEGRKRGFVDAMPWYLLVGPTGTGKSPLVENSGLRMPLEDRVGRAGLETRISGGSVRWWVTDEAMLIRASASIVSDSGAATQGATAWRGLLDFLLTQRPRRPLDGVIIVVGADTLLNGQAAALSAILRQRLREAVRVLSASLQVYVVVSQCDRLAGFEEFFGSLDRDARQRPLGAAIPPSGQPDVQDSASKLRVELSKVLDVVSKMLPFRIAAERDPRRRSLIVGFPEQFSRAGHAAVEFAADLAAPDQRKQSVVLRGLFFVSTGKRGTEASPTDYWQAGFGRAMGLVSATRASPETARESGSPYFVTGLLRDFIFPEAGLTGRSPRAERRAALVYTFGYAACLLGAGSVIGLWYVDFRDKMADLFTLRDAVAVERSLLPSAQPSRGLPAVLPLLNQARKLVEIDGRSVDQTDIHLAFGTLSTNAADRAAQENYRSMLISRLLPALKIQLEEELRTGMAVGLSDDELTGLLMSYLMLDDPIHYQRTVIVNWASKLINRSFIADATRQRQMYQHLSALLAWMPVPTPLDNALVNSVRSRLRNYSEPDRIYAHLVDQARRSNKAPAIDIAQALGPASSQLLMLRTQAGLPVTIPGLYTLDGFNRIFLISAPLLVAGQEQNDWVLGPSNPNQFDHAQVNLRAVTALYVRDYVRHWQSVVDQIALRALPDLPTLVNGTQTLSGPDSPIKQFVELIKQHTDLPAAAAPAAPATPLISRLANSADSVVGEVGPREIASAAVAAANKAVNANTVTFDTWPGDAIRVPFASLHALLQDRNGQPPIMTVQTAFAAAYSTLAGIASAPVPRIAAHQIAAKVISGQSADPLISLRTQAATLPKPVNAIFRELHGNSWNVLLGLSHEQAQVAWSQDVAPICDQAIGRRYPFTSPGEPAGEQDTTLRDFTAFFGPGGLIDKFVSGNLIMFTQVNQDGDLALSSQSGLSLGLSRDALAEINRARRIRDLYFGTEGGLSIRFSLTPSYLDPKALAATLTVGQTRLTYRHEPPRATRFSWPADVEANATLSIEAADGGRPELRASGPWAIFRLLDQAEQSLGSTRDQIQIMFKVGEMRVGYTLRASSVANPLAQRNVRGFRCVARL